MPQYNPNQTWESKKRPAVYAPPGSNDPPPPTAEEEIEEADEEPKRTRLLLWAVGIFAAVIGGGTFLLLYFRPPTGPNVGIEFTKPDQVLLGNAFELDVSPANYSANILKGATLVVTLPNQMSFIGQPTSQRTVQESLGDLGPGSVTPQRFNLIVTGGKGSVQHVTVALKYHTDAAPTTPFETDAEADVVVGGPAVAVTVTAPANIYSGQDFQFTVAYANNTNQSFSDVALQVNYPPAFAFSGSSVAPSVNGSQGDSVWNIGAIAPGGTGTITVTGNITGPSGATYILDGALTGSVQGNTYTLDDESADLAIGSSPLQVSVALNGSTNYIVHPGDFLTYTINFVNNSDVTFQNLAVRATLVGAFYNLPTVQTDGSLNSLTNTVSWNGATTPALLSLAPGESGSVTLGVQAAAAYPIRLVSDKNYTVRLTAKVSSATVPPGVTASSTASTAVLVNKVGGALTLASEGFWRDAAAGILNPGPYPPVVNKPTDYTIHWIITNYATDMEGVTLSANLQSGTTCTGVIKSNMPTAPTCNPANGQVTWTIPSVAATTGITGPPAEAIFQVQNLPAVNQANSIITLLSQTNLTATDGFTSSSITASAPAVMTDLPNDASIPPNAQRTVMPQ